MNAAVTLANDLGADQFVCDEFSRLALVHASMADARLLTTPSLLLALGRSARPDVETAEDLLATTSEARSGAGDASVDRARATLRGE